MSTYGIAPSTVPAARKSAWRWELLGQVMLNVLMLAAFVVGCRP